MAFWLRHKTAVASTWTQVQFEGLSFYEKKEVTRLNGETLRDNLYSHIKGKRKTFAIVISADETTTNEDFLQDLWEAEMIQVSKLDTPDAGNDAHGTLVITEGGLEPSEFIEGFPDLKEYTFNFREAL